METIIPAEDNANNTSTALPDVDPNSAWEKLKWFGGKVVAGMEAVGEVVAGVLGLDESRFQYVIDGMDKEDWQLAVNCENERREHEHIEGVVTIESLAETGLVPAYILEENEEEYHPAPGDEDYTGDLMERGVMDTNNISLSNNDTNHISNNPSEKDMEMVPVPVASSLEVAVNTNADTNMPIDINVVKVSVMESDSPNGSACSCDSNEMDLSPASPEV